MNLVPSGCKSVHGTKQALQKIETVIDHWNHMDFPDTTETKINIQNSKNSHHIVSEIMSGSQEHHS